MRRLAVVLLVAALASACAAAPAATTTAAAPTPSDVTPSASVATAAAPSAPPLGAWTTTCADPAADAAALRGNLMAQPQFAGQKASTVAGWAVATATAVAPLKSCQTSHLLAVAALIKDVDGDKAAATLLAAKVVAFARGRTVQLSGTRVARLVVGATTYAEALPVLKAIFGPPTYTGTGGCELSGESFKTIGWDGFTLQFDQHKAGKPLDNWEVRTSGKFPSNLTLVDGLPFKTTVAALKGRVPSLTVEDMFDTGAGPWVGEARPGLNYVWLDLPAKSFSVKGGPLHGCE